MSKPSVILLGSKPGSVVALSLMLQRGWDIRYVIASQEHEHDWMPKPALSEFSRAGKLEVLDSQHAIPEGIKVDFVISYMCRNLVKPRTLGMANRAALNFHPGLLPEFGGWAFYNVAILEDAKEYGCTCHYMDEGFDTGPLLKLARFPINAEQETAISLEGKTQQEMVRLFRDFCEMAENGEPLPLVHQDPLRMRYMKQAEFEKLKEIPIDADAEIIEKRARAFWYPPYACAYMTIAGKRIELVPQLAKEQFARDVHANDLQKLLVAAGLSTSSPGAHP